MQISVIIPTFNEEATLPCLLSELSRLPLHEVIIADGGSTDQTWEIASVAATGRAHRPFAVQVICAGRKRAVQLNAGAVLASGEVYWFLHADSRLSALNLWPIEEALEKPSVVGGGFSLEIQDPHPIFRIISFGANFRARYTNLILGDQGLFVRASAFKELGGFNPNAMLEDVDFSDRLKEKGEIAMLKEKISTSSRKWRTHGIVQTTLHHWKTYLAYRRLAQNNRILEMR
ncbi:MAG: TIGR04283 family arsenosugar biosynthesis glycosyltransferase [Deltaproteobacteria bacterium]|nr:TIGR04283 family arsenosugar biosynthesis glycosyltransferase [Deltaproteobacteria bacterium]